MPLLSVLTPCYNEEESVELFYEQTVSYLKQMDCDYEIIFVDDGSKDKTVEKCLSVKGDQDNVHLISFSRNFGKEAAMLAGLREAKGDFIVLMDTDLQDPPSLLPEMLKTLQEGEYDCVATYRKDRVGEPPIRSFFARMFYRLINKMIEVEIVDGARDFRMMSRQMVDSILSLSEYHRFSKGLFVWVGYKTKYLAYENIERVAGTSKFSFWKLFKYAIEGFTAFTTFPLRIASLIGIPMCGIAFLVMIIQLIVAIPKYNFLNPFAFIIAVIFFATGLILTCIGLMGEYLARTYMEVKKRPVYIVKKRY